MSKPCNTLLIAAFLTGCATTQAPAVETIAQANLLSSDGVSLGQASLMRAGPSLTLNVSVKGISAGEHGFHLHTAGVCIAPDFKSAGGHLNPAGNAHGPFDESGGHLGDLLNIDVDADGTAMADYPLVGERDELIANLFDSDGTAIVIHAGPDDYETDPAGAAGPRIACGVLERSR